MKKMASKIIAAALCSAMCLSTVAIKTFASEENSFSYIGLDESVYTDYIETETGEVLSLPKNEFEPNKLGWYEADDGYIYIYNKKTNVISHALCRYAHMDKFVVPDNFTNISGQLFGLTYGTVIDKIYIPKTVESIQIEGLAYLKCGEYIVDEDNPNFCSVDGVVYTKDMKCIVACPVKSENKIYTMPESIEESYTFVVDDMMNCSNIEYFIFSPSFNLSNFYIDSVEQALNNSKSKLKAVYYKGVPDRDQGTLANAKEALKMAIGIEEEQLDLKAYVENGVEKYLYDADGNGTVDLKEAKSVLSRALGIIE